MAGDHMPPSGRDLAPGGDAGVAGRPQTANSGRLRLTFAKGDVEVDEPTVVVEL